MVVVEKDTGFGRTPNLDYNSSLTVFVKIIKCLYHFYCHKKAAILNIVPNPCTSVGPVHLVVVQRVGQWTVVDQNPHLFLLRKSQS